MLGGPKIPRCWEKQHQKCHCHTPFCVPQILAKTRTWEQCPNMLAGKARGKWQIGPILRIYIYIEWKTEKQVSPLRIRGRTLILREFHVCQAWQEITFQGFDLNQCITRLTAIAGRFGLEIHRSCHSSTVPETLRGEFICDKLTISLAPYTSHSGPKSPKGWKKRLKECWKSLFLTFLRLFNLFGPWGREAQERFFDFFWVSGPKGQKLKWLL